MSREKQIEEMAKVIQKGELDRNKGDLDCTEFPTDIVIKVGLQRLAGAKALYNANYRKRSENVIELPCKIGDTIYLPWKWKDTSGIAILTVERISITEAGQSIRTDFWSDDEDYWLAYNCGVFYFDDIGKIVFITKAEAEQALAKTKGGAE